MAKQQFNLISLANRAGSFLQGDGVIEPHVPWTQHKGCQVAELKAAGEPVSPLLESIFHNLLQEDPEILRGVEVTYYEVSGETDSFNLHATDAAFAVGQVGVGDEVHMRFLGEDIGTWHELIHSGFNMPLPYGGTYAFKGSEVSPLRVIVLSSERRFAAGNR